MSQEMRPSTPSRPLPDVDTTPQRAADAAEVPMERSLSAPMERVIPLPSSDSGRSSKETRRAKKKAKGLFRETAGVLRTQKAELLLRTRQIGRQSQEEKSGLPGPGGRVIVVANRLPMSLSRDEETGKMTSKKSSGGLVSALMGVKGLNMVWVGWPGKPIPEAERPEVVDLCRGQGCEPVFLDAETVKLYYDGFSNNVLWPLFHYIPLPIEDSKNTERDQWLAYNRANRAFADKVLEIVRDGDAVWFHDYHLMLAPSMLREAQPRMQIGWFLHTPFPSSEIYRSLSYRSEILRGVLSADLVGFHTFDYGRHFLNACTRILGLEYTPYGVEYNGHLARVGTFPIGIEPAKFERAIEDPETEKHLAEFEKRFAGRRVVVGIDRLDMIKGIPQKLLAFERFLEDHPEWRDKVVLVQVAVPSRIGVPEYQRLRQRVHELVGRINGRFGTLSSSPLHYLDQSVPFNVMCALYRVASVAFISSVRDGMNLVSYEYTVCQRDRHGVLVLSEFAGAAQSLGAGAVLINPWNVRETAAAFHDALTMPEEERRERHAYLFRYVARHTSQHWAANFLRDLTDTREEAVVAEAKLPNRLLPDMAEPAYHAARGRLIVLGFQGTLTAAEPAQKNARLKRPDLNPVVAHIRTLANDPRNQVLVVSASPREDLDKHFGALPVYLAAENGTYVRPGGRDQEWRVMDSPDLSWMDSAFDVFQYFAERTPGAVVERRETSLVFNFRNVESVEFGRLQSRDILVHLFTGPLAVAPVDVLQGAKSLEVRYMGITKGQMTRRVLHEMLCSPESPLSSHLQAHEVEFVFASCYCLERDGDFFQLFADLAAHRKPLSAATRGTHGPSGTPLSSQLSAKSPRTRSNSGARKVIPPPSSSPQATATATAAARTGRTDRSRCSTLDAGDSDTQLSEDEVLHVAASMSGDRSLGTHASLARFAGATMSRAGSTSKPATATPSFSDLTRGDGSQQEDFDAATGAAAATAATGHSGESHSSETGSAGQLAMSALRPETAFACMIGREQTPAEYYLRDEKDVARILQRLAESTIANPPPREPSLARSRAGSGVSLSDVGKR